MHKLPLTAALALASLAAAQTTPGKPDLRAVLGQYPHRLVFETERDGNWEIYSMAADGSDAKNLTKTKETDEVYPQVSPDGRWLAFCADTGAGGKRCRSIYFMPVEGGERIKVADHARDPFWSPDSNSLGFLPDEFPTRFSLATWATKGLAFYNLETRQTHAHENDELRHLYCPQWIDDRWLLATVHGGLGFRHAIVLIERQGLDVHRLHIPGCRAELASDGKQLTWGYGETSLGLGTLDLAADSPSLTIDGRVVRNSPRGHHTYHASWSPDGRFVAYSSGPPDRTRRLNHSVMPQCPGVTAPDWDVWVADSSGQNLRLQLTTCGNSNKEPTWIPIRSTDKDAGR